MTDFTFITNLKKEIVRLLGGGYYVFFYLTVPEVGAKESKTPIKVMISNSGPSSFKSDDRRDCSEIKIAPIAFSVLRWVQLLDHYKDNSSIAY